MITARVSVCDKADSAGNSLRSFLCGRRTFSSILLGFNALMPSIFCIGFPSVISFLGAYEVYAATISEHCPVIQNADGLEVRNLIIGPCEGPGISIVDSKNIKIDRVKVLDTVGAAVLILNSINISIQHSDFERNASGIYALKSSDISVQGNRFKNVRGPMPRGQFVQFNQVSGRSRISKNCGLNELGKSSAEDAISIYKSRGTKMEPLLVDHNTIIGGGPSHSGGGIMLGDGGGEFIEAISNRLINPGQYGIGVAGGNHIVVENNEVIASRAPYTNVGIYVWNQSDELCAGIEIRRNKVSWLSSSGKPNPWWSADNCQKVVLEGNSFKIHAQPEIVGKVQFDDYCSAVGTDNGDNAH